MPRQFKTRMIVQFPEPDTLDGFVFQDSAQIGQQVFGVVFFELGVVGPASISDVKLGDINLHFGFHRRELCNEAGQVL